MRGMRGKQKTTQNNFKLIKIKKDTYKELLNLIYALENKHKYLKGVISFEVVIKMLLLKNKIKLSKYTYLKKDLRKLKKGVLKKWIKKKLKN